jgi:hypothetical protein
LIRLKEKTVKPKVTKLVDWFLEYSDGTTYIVASIVVFAYMGMSVLGT